MNCIVFFFVFLFSLPFCNTRPKHPSHSALALLDLNTAGNVPVKPFEPNRETLRDTDTGYQWQSALVSSVQCWVSLSWITCRDKRKRWREEDADKADSVLFKGEGEERKTKAQRDLRLRPTPGPQGHGGTSDSSAGRSAGWQDVRAGSWPFLNVSLTVNTRQNSCRVSWF